MRKFLDYYGSLEYNGNGRYSDYLEMSESDKAVYKEMYRQGCSMDGSYYEPGILLDQYGEGEAAESWHSRQIFYSGGGAGYSGRPEQGDTLYLYFPTESEESRCVIGGGGAGYETLRALTQ